MSEFVTCASCGARNGGEAVWCSMCFEPLRVPEPEQSSPEPVEQELPTLESDAEAVVVTVDTGAPLADADAFEDPDPPAHGEDVPASASNWMCRTCNNENSMSADVCPVCGTTIFETMGGATDEITLTQDQGLRLGLVPGLAHARMGEPVVGFIIAVLVLACLGFGFVFIAAGGAVWGLVVGLVGLATWGVSVFDVNQRIAGAAPILRPRVMTIIGGLVVIVIMVAGFVAGATAVRSPGS